MPRPLFKTLSARLILIPWLCHACSAAAPAQTTPNPTARPVQDNNPNPPAIYGPRTTGAPYRFWRNVRIDGGGFVSGLIPGEALGGPLYARTDVGGAYRWNSTTKTWFPITDNLGGSLQIESIAADPNDPNLVYVASGGGIHRSTNQGGSWTGVKIPARMGGNDDGRNVGERLAIDPNRTSTLLFGSRHDGLLRSDDSGATWKKVGGFTDWKPEIGITFVLFDKKSGSPGSGSQTIYAGVSGNSASLYQSTDGGATWTAVPDQPKDHFPNHGVLTPAGVLFLTYANAGGPNGMSDGAVWRYDPSAKSGETWKNISPVEPGKGSGDFFGYGSLALDPRDPNTLLVATMCRWNWGDAMWRTTNANAETPEWTELFSRKLKPKWLSPAPYKQRDTHWISDIEFHPSQPDQVFFGFGQGVHRTDNVSAGADATWTLSAQGLEETVVLALTSPSSGPPLLSGLGDIGGFAHPDLSASPAVQHSTGNTTGVDFAALAPAIMARVGSGPGKYSADGGLTWVPFPSQPGKGGSIAISADGKTFLWMGDGSPCLSRDRGEKWQPVPTLPAKSKIASDRMNPNKFYGFDSGNGTVYSSTDGGATFTASTTKLPNSPWYFRSSIRAVPGFEGHIYIAGMNSVHTGALFKSTDSGRSFVPISGIDGKLKEFTTNTSVRSIAAIGFGKGLLGRRYPALYLAGKMNLPESGEVNGIFRSDDGGTSWIRINDDNHRFNANVIAGDSRTPGRVYLGTDGRGIVVGDP